MEVTTELENGKTQKQYYVKDIGLVANVYEDNDIKVETLLQAIKKRRVFRIGYRCILSFIFRYRNGIFKR